MEKRDVKNIALAALIGFMTLAIFILSCSVAHLQDKDDWNESVIENLGKQIVYQKEQWADDVDYYTIRIMELKNQISVLEGEAQ